jgi:phage host-nuclease inhibitor protein Gam
MARVKPAAQGGIVYHSVEEADRALCELAALKRQTSAAEDELNAAIDAAKLAALQKTAGARAKTAAIEAALVAYAEYNKPLLFARRKSLELTYGVIGFRLSSKLTLIAKHSWERVLQNLRDNGLCDLIRVREEPDREALKGLPPEHLKDLGCKVQQAEVFYYEITEQELPQGEGV